MAAGARVLSTIERTLTRRVGRLAAAWGFVDVRDVARAHLLAMENPEASGRYILWNETLTMRQTGDLVRKHFPQYPVPTTDMTSSVGNANVYLASYLQPSGTGKYIRTNLKTHPLLDNSKVKALGLQFTPIEETIVGMSVLVDARRCSLAHSHGGWYAHTRRLLQRPDCSRSSPQAGLAAATQTRRHRLLDPAAARGTAGALLSLPLVGSLALGSSCAAAAARYRPALPLHSVADASSVHQQVHAMFR